MYLAGLSIMVTMGYFQERIKGVAGGRLPPATPSTSPKTAPGHLVSERVDCVKDCILLSTPPARLIFSASS